jgi:hypothetical protein
MSHIVTIETKVHDSTVVAVACAKLGLAAPTHGTAQLFSDEVSGLLIQLPGWQYPVVVDTDTGMVRYDNYNGRWGDQKQLDRLVQRYAVEKARLEARKRGYEAIIERRLDDGSIEIEIHVGGVE